MWITTNYKTGGGLKRVTPVFLPDIGLTSVLYTSESLKHLDDFFESTIGKQDVPCRVMFPPQVQQVLVAVFVPLRLESVLIPLLRGEVMSGHTPWTVARVLLVIQHYNVLHTIVCSLSLSSATW